jgi:hypothetical protein
VLSGVAVKVGVAVFSGVLVTVGVGEYSGVRVAVAVEVKIFVGVESMTIFEPESERSPPCSEQPDNKAKNARRGTII